MESLSIHGFYGMQNFGDDLFCLTMEQVAADYFPDAQTVLAAPALDGCGLGSLYPSALPQSWFSRPDPMGAALRLATGVRAFTSTSTLVLAGGSVATRLAGVRRAQAEASRYIHKDWIALGISVGPFVNDGDQEMVRDFLARFRFVGVRDEASLDRCRDFGLADRSAMMGDLVGLLRRPQFPDPQVTGRVVLVPCRSASAETWASILHLAADGGLPVTVLSLNSHPAYGDDDIAQRGHDFLVQREADSALLRYRDLGVGATWDLLGGAKAVVTGRLHGAVAAYLQGVGFALIDYQEKCGEFLTDIESGSDASLAGPRDPLWWARLTSGELAGPGMSAGQYRDRAQDALYSGLLRPG